MSDLIYNHLHWLRFRRKRGLRGGASLVGFLAGTFLAGRLMMALGWFTLGVTPNGDILDYWPGFLTGGAVGAVLLQVLAFAVRRRLFVEDDE